MAKERIAWLDYAKGLGIILVIYGHAICPNAMNVWLCSFHMPLFFILSGFTFPSYNKYSFKEFTVKKFKSVIIPYFVFAACLVLWKLVCVPIQGGVITDVFKAAVGILIQVRTTAYGPGAWFLPALFLAEIIVYLIINVFKNKTVPLAISAAVLMSGGYLYCNFIDKKLPWGLDAAVVASAFVILGYLVKKHFWEKLQTSKIFSWFGFVFLIINIPFAYLNYKILSRTIGMWSNAYGNILYFLVAALSGTAFIIWLCMKIPFGKIISNIGKNSLIYYGIHIVFVQFFMMVIRKFASEQMLEQGIYQFIFGTVIVILTVIIVNFLCPVFKRIFSLLDGSFKSEKSRN